MATLNELLTKCGTGEINALELINEMTPGGVGNKRLTIECKKQDPQVPVRCESKPRNHVFYAADGFLAYLLKYGKDGTVIYGDPKAGVIAAVLDEISVKGFEVVSFVPMPHPLWAPWEALIGRTIGLDDFVEFVQMNRRAVIDPPGRELVLMFSQVKASTTVDLHRGRGKESLNGLLIKTKIQGVEKDQTLELPESLILDVPLFVRTEPQRIDLALNIETAEEGKGIVIGLSSADILEAKFKAFEKIFESLSTLKEKGMTITLGAPRYSNWEYLKS